MNEGVESVSDLILFNATPDDIRALSLEIERYKKWLSFVGLPNTLDNWTAWRETV